MAVVANSKPAKWFERSIEPMKAMMRLRLVPTLIILSSILCNILGGCMQGIVGGGVGKVSKKWFVLKSSLMNHYDSYVKLHVPVSLLTGFPKSTSHKLFSPVSQGTYTIY